MKASNPMIPGFTRHGHYQPPDVRVVDGSGSRDRERLDMGLAALGLLPWAVTTTGSSEARVPLRGAVERSMDRAAVPSSLIG